MQKQKAVNGQPLRNLKGFLLYTMHGANQRNISISSSADFPLSD